MLKCTGCLPAGWILSGRYSRFINRYTFGIFSYETHALRLPTWLHTDVNPCLRLCTNGDQQYRSGERSIRTDSPRPEYPSRFTLGDNHTRSVNYVPTSISVPMRRSCTNSIDGLCLGSAFQQSHINDHRRSVISDDSGRLGRTPLITSKITVGSCFLFEKGFVPV